ncbi:MAG: ABC transporter permease [Chloroflexia bacterium]
MRIAALRGDAVHRRRRRLRFSPAAPALLGGAILAALAVVAIFTPRLAPHTTAELEDPLFQTGQVQALAPPFWDRRGDDPCETCDPYSSSYRATRATLGTDAMGRDMLSLLLYGMRYSLVYGVLAVALIAAVGVALGLAAGWRGGVFDYVAMRAADVFDAVPAILAYILVATVTAGLLAGVLTPLGLYLDAIPVTALVLSSVGWAATARLVRGQVRALKQEEWVLAARAVGVPGARIALRHLLPHAVGPAFVAATCLPAMLIMEGAGVSGSRGVRDTASAPLSSHSSSHRGGALARVDADRSAHRDSARGDRALGRCPARARPDAVLPPREIAARYATGLYLAAGAEMSSRLGRIRAPKRLFVQTDAIMIQLENESSGDRAGGQRT